MIKYKKWIGKINRSKESNFSRFKKITLDKNERVSDFEKNFFKKIVSKISSSNFIKYPEVYDLYQALSSLHKISRKCFVITAGIDAAIKNCFELFVSRGNKVIVLNPTFAMVDIYCKIYGAKKIKINYDKKLNINTDLLIKSINKNISLIIIANPNSPTGTIISKRDIENIIKRAKKFNTPILVDEAYYGFTNQTVFPLLKKYNNLIISRTFSKAYGLAGLRVGYLISNKQISKLFFNLKPMYEINSIGVLACLQILKNSFIRNKYISDTNKGLKLIIKYFNENNIPFIKTNANFIYMHSGKKTNKIFSILKRQGILTKKGMSVKGFKNYLRITLAPPKQIKLIISKLKKIKI